jgi:cytochrome c-type biogenesis protein
VLAGAIALSATSGTILGGLVLGAAYVAGMMVPLIPLALVYGRARNRVTDPKITLRVGSHAKRIGAIRLVGVVLFAGFGSLFIALALSGNSETAPGFQKTLGRWMRELSDYLDNIPNVVALPVLVLLLAGVAYALVRTGGRREPEKG